MKRILAVCLTVILLLFLTGCGLFSGDSKNEAVTEAITTEIELPTEVYERQEILSDELRATVLTIIEIADNFLDGVIDSQEAYSKIEAFIPLPVSTPHKIWDDIFTLRIHLFSDDPRDTLIQPVRTARNELATILEIPLLQEITTEPYEPRELSDDEIIEIKIVIIETIDKLLNDEINFNEASEKLRPLPSVTIEGRTFGGTGLVISMAIFIEDIEALEDLRNTLVESLNMP